jgi:hypothetical protein
MLAADPSLTPSSSIRDSTEPTAYANISQLWQFPDDLLEQAAALALATAPPPQAMGGSNAPSTPPANGTVAPPPHKLVVKAMTGPAESDVGKGWLVYSQTPAAQADPLGLSRLRLSLQGMDGKGA